MDESEKLAKQFHETYERLAPSFGYETRKDSAVPWEAVPEKNRKLMVAVCGEIAAQSQASLAAAQQLALCPLHQQYKRFCAICATELEAAARAQALEPIRDHFRQWANDLEKEGKYEAAQYIRATEVFVSAELSVTPSDSTALAKLRDDSQRMWDLVRYQRDELHEANLISDDEYALLAKDHAGVKRLESYDAVRASVAKLFAEERLAELNLIPQSEHWSTGLEGYMVRRKDTLTDIVAARVAELKGEQK